MPPQPKDTHSIPDHTTEGSDMLKVDSPNLLQQGIPDETVYFPDSEPLEQALNQVVDTVVTGPTEPLGTVSKVTRESHVMPPERTTGSRDVSGSSASAEVKSSDSNKTPTNLTGVQLLHEEGLEEASNPEDILREKAIAWIQSHTIEIKDNWGLPETRFEIPREPVPVEVREMVCIELCKQGQTKTVAENVEYFGIPTKKVIEQIVISNPHILYESESLTGLIAKEREVREALLTELCAHEEFGLIAASIDKFPGFSFSLEQQQRVLRTQAVAIAEFPDVFPAIDLSQHVETLRETGQIVVVLQHKNIFPDYILTIEDATKILDTPYQEITLAGHIAEFQPNDREVVVDKILDKAANRVDMISGRLLASLAFVDEATAQKIIERIACTTRGENYDDFVAEFAKLPVETQDILLTGIMRPVSDSANSAVGSSLEDSVRLPNNELMGVLSDSQKKFIIARLIEEKALTIDIGYRLSQFGDLAQWAGETILETEECQGWMAEQVIRSLSDCDQYDKTKVLGVLYRKEQYETIIMCMEYLPDVNVDFLVDGALRAGAAGVLLQQANKVPGLVLDANLLNKCIISGAANEAVNYLYKFELNDQSISVEAARALILQGQAELLFKDGEVKRTRFKLPEDQAWLTEEVSTLLAQSEIGCKYLKSRFMDAELYMNTVFSKDAVLLILDYYQKVRALGLPSGGFYPEMFLKGLLEHPQLTPSYAIDNKEINLLLKSGFIETDTVCSIFEYQRDTIDFPLTLDIDILGEEYILKQLDEGGILTIFNLCSLKTKQFIADQYQQHLGVAENDFYEKVFSGRLNIDGVKMVLKTEHVAGTFRQNGGLTAHTVVDFYAKNPSLFEGVSQRDIAAEIILGGKTGELFTSLSRFHDQGGMLGNGTILPEVKIDNSLADLMLSLGEKGAVEFVTYENFFPDYPQKDERIRQLIANSPKCFSALLNFHDRATIYRIAVPFETIEKWSDNIGVMNELLLGGALHDCFVLTTPQKQTLASRMQPSLLRTFKDSAHLDSSQFGGIDRGFQTLFRSYIEYVDALPVGAQPKAVRTLLSIFAADAISLEELSLAESVAVESPTFAQQQELAVLGVKSYGDKGLEQLKDSLNTLATSIISGSIDTQVVDLVEQSSIARTMFKKIVRFDNSTWGSHSNDELNRLLTMYKTQLSDSPELITTTYSRSVSQVEELTSRKTAVGDANQVSEGLILPEATLDRYLVLSKEISEVAEIFAGTSNRRNTGFRALDTSIETLAVEIEGLITDLEQKKDKLTHPKAVDSVNNQLSILRSVVSATKNKTEGGLRDLKNFAQTFSALSEFGELSSQLRKIAFTWSFIKNDSLNTDEAIGRLRTLPDMPDITDMSTVIDMVDHIVNRETFASYFLDEADARKFTRLTSVQRLQEAINKDQTRRASQSSDKKQAKRTSIEFMPDRGILMELSGHIGDACWASKYRSIAEALPNMTAVIMRQNPGTKREKLIGSFMVIETINEETGKPIFVIRGLNPVESVINGLAPSSFLDAVEGYVREQAISKDADVGIVIDDHSGGSSTNRPVLFGFLSALKGTLTNISVPTLNTTFNKYNITKNVYVLPQKQEIEG